MSGESGDGKLQTFNGRVYSTTTTGTSHPIHTHLSAHWPSVHLLCADMFFVMHRWQAYALPIPLGTFAVPAAEVWQLHCTVSTQQCKIEPKITSPP